MLGDVYDYIQRATDCLKAGDMAGLEALNSRADTLSSAMESLDAAQGAEYAPELAELRTQLNALIRAMDDMKTQLGKTLQSSGTHHRAARAYLTTPES
jgi:uncharacterized phage infection (PIP) family protein YhgE